MRSWACLLWGSVALLAQAPEGAALFQKHCAACHKPGGENRAPLPEALFSMSRRAILTSLETGTMKAQGAALSETERNTVAEWLSAHGRRAPEGVSGLCPAPPAVGPVGAIRGWNGWGMDLANTRYQLAGGLAAADVPRLKLKMGVRFSERVQHARTAHRQRRPLVFRQR